MPTPSPLSNPTRNPTAASTQAPNFIRRPTALPTSQPTIRPTESPVARPTESPTRRPTRAPTNQPTSVPTLVPTSRPTSRPTITPTQAPTETKVCNPPITEEEREAQLLDIVDNVSDAADIQTPLTPQRDAFIWLIDSDSAQVCPEEPTSVISRYVLAVLYFSTSGDDWFECNAELSSILAPCESDSARYLSAESVCQWFNVACDGDDNIISISLGKYCFLCFLSKLLKTKKRFLNSTISLSNCS
jgi:hypothetical protein